MNKDHIGYDKLMDSALRGAIRSIIEDVVENGLPGDHQFYITFLTTYPGVRLPSYLLEEYPEELTIVLQNQFWELEVSENNFSVTLSFNKRHENICIPFAALKSFADPSVKFGLQFREEPLNASKKLELVTKLNEALDNELDADGDAMNKAIDRSQDQRDAAEKPTISTEDTNPEQEDVDTDREKVSSEEVGKNRDVAGADIVTLDSFRKK